MCIIIYSPKGDLSKKQLKASLKNNPDGWGIMWPDNGNVQIVQGMTDGEFFNHWKWIRNIKAPKVFHARIGTHGTKDINNCHPFVVPNHGQLAVAHNGIIYQQTYKGDKSDTRNFVDNILAKLPVGFQKEEIFQELLTDYVNKSKLVFMDGNGAVEIINEDEGNWMHGSWYSNSSYKSWQTTCSFGFRQKQASTIPASTTPASNGYVTPSSYCLLPSPARKATYEFPDNRLPEVYRKVVTDSGLNCVNP